MTTAQWIYVGLFVIYSILFLIFSRMFYWGYFAEKNYYRRRPGNLSQDLIADMAHQAGKEIPRFSVFVPARNEADVISKTIDHLAHMDYSADHYEILVVTDEKEVQAAEKEREQLVEQLGAFLAGDGPWPGGERTETVMIALLSKLALKEAQLAERKSSQQLSTRELLSLARHQREEILHEFAHTLITGKGKVERNRLHDVIRRSVPGLNQAGVARLYPLFIGFAIPTVIAANQLRKEQPEKLANRMLSEAAQARQPLTQKVLTALSETVSNRIVRRIQSAPAERLHEWIQEACTLAMPTTQEIVERKRMEFAGQRALPALKHVVVPWDFDGEVDGQCTGEFVPSTKGRALNYAFRYADHRASMWAFWDAESRPARQALQYVAWCRLTMGEKFQIAQGPVFQVRNFWQMGPVCKIASLFQAVAHEWNLPWLLRSLPFVGGTNMFVSRNLMLQIKGFDRNCLTEDMELGARAWLKEGVWPHFVPCPSSEQTPPTFRMFFRQRLRWGSGYVQVYNKIKADLTLPEERKAKLLRTYLVKGPLSWILFQMAALLPLPIVFLHLHGLVDSSAAPWYLTLFLKLLPAVYLSFTLYCFFHFARHMDKAPAAKRITGFSHLLTLPVSAFFLPLPYSSALMLKFMGREPRGWVKTPRTKE